MCRTLSSADACALFVTTPESIWHGVRHYRFVVLFASDFSVFGAAHTATPFMTIMGLAYDRAKEAHSHVRPPTVIISRAFICMLMLILLVRFMVATLSNVCVCTPVQCDSHDCVGKMLAMAEDSGRKKMHANSTDHKFKNYLHVFSGSGSQFGVNACFPRQTTICRRTPANRLQIHLRRILWHAVKQSADEQSINKLHDSVEWWWYMIVPRIRTYFIYLHRAMRCDPVCAMCVCKRA